MMNARVDARDRWTSELSRRVNDHQPEPLAVMKRYGYNALGGEERRHLCDGERQDGTSEARIPTPETPDHDAGSSERS